MQMHPGRQGTLLFWSGVWVCNPWHNGSVWHHVPWTGSKLCGTFDQSHSPLNVVGKGISENPCCFPERGHKQHWEETFHRAVSQTFGRRPGVDLQRCRCQRNSSPHAICTRGRCRKLFLQILSRHKYFFVFLNFKRGFFSWTFWFGASFICKNAYLCLHSGFTWWSRAKYIEWSTKYVKPLNMWF